MNVKVEKKEKSTLDLIIVVPNDRVRKVHSEILDQIAESAELPGFRKGQAPINLVEEKTDKSKLQGEVIDKLLQLYYPQALKENKISPISNPKVIINEFDLEKDFKFTATVAIKPEIKIGDYRKELAKLYKKNKTEFDAENTESDKNKKVAYQMPSGEIINKLVEMAKIEISDILVDQEVNRMFSRLIQQIQAVGMSIEDYIKSQNSSIEKLTEQYKKISEDNIKAEFILTHLIKKENLEVSDEEIDQMINTTGGTEIQEQMQTDIQKTYIRSMLLKNKLIQNLLMELEGNNENTKGNDTEKDKSTENDKNTESDKKINNSKGKI